MIMFSRGKMDLDEKQKLLEDSLKVSFSIFVFYYPNCYCFLESQSVCSQILKGVCPKINLSAICSQYLDVGFYIGIYELCQLCATKLDPKNIGLQFYRNGGLPYTPEHVAYTQR